MVQPAVWTTGVIRAASVAVVMVKGCICIIPVGYTAVE